MPESERRCRPDWIILFRSFRMANDWAKVSLAFLGIAVMLFVLVLGSVGFLLLRQTEGGATSRAVLAAVGHNEFSKAVGLLSKGIADTAADSRIEAKRIGAALLTANVGPAIQHATTLRKIGPWALIGMFVTWLIWAYFGGGVSRAAAFDLATGDRLTAIEARSFASRHYRGYLWGPLGLLVLMILFTTGLLLIGLAARHIWSAALVIVGLLASLYIGVVVKQRKKSNAVGGVAGLILFIISVVLAVLFWPVGPAWLERLALIVLFPAGMLVGVAIALGLIVLVFGRGMMCAAVSFEGTESFDAITRAADYVLKRPWRLIFYWLVGLAFGVPCFGVVCALAAAAFLIAAAGLFTGFGTSFLAMADLLANANVPMLDFVPAFLLVMIATVLAGLVLSWGVAFAVSYRTICYALVRKSVDLSEITEVYQEAGRIPGSA